MNPIERFKLMRFQNSFENFSDSDKNVCLDSPFKTKENNKSFLHSCNKNVLTDSDTNADTEDSRDSDDSSFYENASDSSVSSDEDSCGSDSSSSDEEDEESNFKKNVNQLHSNRYQSKQKQKPNVNNHFSDSTDFNTSESESDEDDALNDSIGKDSGSTKVKGCVPPPPPPPLPDFILTRESKIIIPKRIIASVRQNVEKGLENTLDKVMQELLAGRCMLKPVNSRSLRKIQSLPDSQDLQSVLAAALKKRFKSINNKDDDGKNENDDSAYDDSQGSQSELDDGEQTKESVQMHEQQ